MKKLLVMQGSPRANGLSSALLQQVIRGAESKGAVISSYDLNDPAFRGCQGCFHCRTAPACWIEDSFQSFYTEIEDASAVLFGSGIYFADVTGQAKMGLDRLFPMTAGYSFTPRYPGKSVVTVFAQGDADPERFSSAAERVHGIFRLFGWALADSFLVTGSDEGAGLTDALLARAFACGENLAE